MNIRQAILKAADSIEQNPKIYSFNQGSKTIGQAGNGCMLVVIGQVANIRLVSDVYSNDVARHLGYCNWGDFVNKCSEIACEYMKNHRKWLSYERPEIAPMVLRLYADKYHPIALPKVVTDIFKVKEAA